MRYFIAAALIMLVPLHAFAQEAAPPAQEAAPAAPQEAAPPAQEAAPAAPQEAAPPAETIDMTAPELEALKAKLTDQKSAEEALEAFRLENITVIHDSMDKLDQMRLGEPVDNAPELAQDVQRRWMLLKAAFELGLDRHPNSALLNNYYGEVMYDAFHDHDVAMKAWNKAIGLDSKLAQPYNNLAMHYFHGGSYKQGLAHMDRALELDPKNPNYLLNMSDIYLIHGPQVSEIREWKKEKVYKEAMKMSKAAIKHSPGDVELMQNYAVNFWKAEEFEVEPDWEEAAEMWQQIRPLAKRDDQLFFAWLNEARSWLQAGKFDKALACAQEAVKLRPESEPAKTVLARAQAGPQQEKP